MNNEELKAYIESHYGSHLTYNEVGKYNLLFEVDAANLVTVSEKLKNDSELLFNYFCNLSGADTTERFEAIYNIASTKKKIRLDIKVILPHENPVIDSVQTIWPAANWYEREMWELYGIHINNHDNLTRFLLHDEWDEGFPMRKDWDAPDFIRFPDL